MRPLAALSPFHGPPAAFLHELGGQLFAFARLDRRNAFRHGFENPWHMLVSCIEQTKCFVDHLVDVAIRADFDLLPYSLFDLRAQCHAHRIAPPESSLANGTGDGQQSTDPRPNANLGQPPVRQFTTCVSTRLDYDKRTEPCPN